MKSKNRVIIASFTIIFMICVAGFGVYLFNKNSSSKAGEEQADGVQTDGEQKVPNFTNNSTASGTLTAGSIQQTIPLPTDTLAELGIEVEEVYVSEGDEVKQGDKILKITDASYQTAKETLERKVEYAKSDLKEEQLNYKTESVNLNLTYQNDQNLKSTAAEEYELEREKLANEVSEAKNKLNEAESIVINHPSTITEYKRKITKYKEKLKNANQKWEEENKRIRTERQKATQAENAYAQIKSSFDLCVSMMDYLENYVKNNNSTDLTGLEQLQTDLKSTVHDKEEQLEKSKNEYEKTKKDLEQAEQSLMEKEKKVTTYKEKLTSIEKKLDEKKDELGTTKSEISSLRISYQKALNKQKTELISLNKKYKEEALTSDQALSNYDLEKERLESALQEAKNAYEKAETELDSFIGTLGDGILYADQDGSIASVGYVEGDVLSLQTPAASYNDGSKLRVTVSVDQSEIHSLAVGKEVNVMVGSSRGSMMIGTIETIEMKKATSSVSQVNYNVTVCIGNTDGNYSGGQTATVLFNAN